MQKLIALVLSLCMLMSVLPAMAENAPAAENENAAGKETPDEAAVLAEQAKALYEAGDYEAALPLFLKAAEMGNPSAQYALGLFYDLGLGVQKDAEKAVEYYRLAADQGLALAQCNLGVCYYNGNGVEQDYEMAVKYTRLAADQGDVQALYNLGNDYFSGRGVEKDYSEAYRLFCLAAEKGNADGLFAVGECYYLEIGVEKDLEAAAEWYRKALDAGFVPRDDEEAAHLKELIPGWVDNRSAESAPAEASARTTKIEAHFASVEEGQQLMRNRTLYHEQINAKNLEFMLQKKGGTLEEFIDYAAEQVQPFEPEEEKRISDILAWMQAQMEKHGLALPDPGTITFVKSSGKEAAGAAGYTSEGAVFLTPEFNSLTEDQAREIFVHEIFHCLSRLFPEFRQAMYSLIHFKVLDHDIDIPQEIRDEIMANPDVEHHNSTAVFTINGEKKECYLVFLTDTVFEKPGDIFINGAYVGIVPIGESVIYRADEVEDFWDVIGRNTNYNEDPEEIMATNFGMTILRLDDGMESFKTPEIPEGIITYLKNGGK